MFHGGGCAEHGIDRCIKQPSKPINRRTNASKGLARSERCKSLPRKKFVPSNVDGNLCDSHRNLKQLSIDRPGAGAVESIIQPAVGRSALSMRVGRRTSLGFYYMTIVQCQLNLCLFCCIILCTFRDKHRNYYQLLSGRVIIIGAEAIYKIVYAPRRIN